MKQKKKLITKKIALIDDIVSYGKCSLGISIPVLSSNKFDVYPAMTALYSAHTAVEGYSKLETGQLFFDSLENWNTQKITFNAIQTGSLSNRDQIYACLELFVNQPKALKIVDPVLGDFGDFYDDNFRKLLPHIKKLCAVADIITPNLTEAKLLTEINSEDPNILLNELNKLGPKKIILTGITNNDKVKNYLLEDNSIYFSESKYYNKIIHGAGDLFLSCFIAALLKNKNTKKSLDIASQITSETVKATISTEGFENRGISFEYAIEKINKKLKD